MAMISPCCPGSLVWFAAAVGCHGPEVLGQPTGQVMHEHATVGTAVGEDGASRTAKVSCFTGVWRNPPKKKVDKSRILLE
jgi:hypothetical protein